MTRRAVVGHGRLLTMAGERATETGPLEGPWVLLIEDGRIAEVRRGELRAGDPEQVDDAGAALVTPGLIDPHTHLIYAGDRADEAAARSRGEHYSSGGILRTVTATNTATDTELVASLQARLAKARAGGTTTIEVKSGYGLEAGAELRLLRLIGEAARGQPLRVRRTYLGAHALPPGLTPAEASAAVTAAIPTVAGEADHIDVFCEPGLFDLEQTRAIARAGAAEGLPLKLHADQLRRSGAALLGVELGALSVDHLEQLAPADVPVLAASPTVATILPGPALMLRAGTPPARELLDAGAVVAIGSDANAGTFGQPSMPLAVGLAVALGFTIDEALRAATVGAATALGLAGQVGRLAPGAVADLVAWDAEHEGAFAHRLGDVAPHRTWYGGECHD